MNNITEPLYRSENASMTKTTWLLFVAFLHLCVTSPIAMSAEAALTLREERGDRGQLLYIFFKDGTQIATGTWSQEQGITATSGTIEDGDYSCTIESSPNTKTIPFVEGKVNGVVKVYYPSGTLWRSTPYSNGKEHGVMRIYHERGWLMTERAYDDGLLHGVSRQFFESGSVKRVAEFDRGKLVRQIDHDDTEHK